MEAKNEVYVAKNKMKIFVGPGGKGRGDFIVYVKTQSGAVPPFISDPEGRPRHIEWVNLYRDFYRFAFTRNPRFSARRLASLPLELARKTIENPYVHTIRGGGSFPTPRAVFREPYKSLLAAVEQHVGLYQQATLDFIVALLELLFIQEEVNYPYPKGVLHVLLPQMLEAELLGSLPQEARQAGETLQSLRDAVTRIAMWENQDTAERLRRKWKSFFNL